MSISSVWRPTARPALLIEPRHCRRVRRGRRGGDGPSSANRASRRPARRVRRGTVRSRRRTDRAPKGGRRDLPGRGTQSETRSAGRGRRSGSGPLGLVGRLGGDRGAAFDHGHLAQCLEWAQKVARIRNALAISPKALSPVASSCRMKSSTCASLSCSSTCARVVEERAVRVEYAIADQFAIGRPDRARRGSAPCPPRDRIALKYSPWGSVSAIEPGRFAEAQRIDPQHRQSSAAQDASLISACICMTCEPRGRLLTPEPSHIVVPSRPE